VQSPCAEAQTRKPSSRDRTQAISLFVVDENIVKFTSYETIEEIPLTVIKKSSRGENFDSKKTEYEKQCAIVKKSIAHSVIEEFLHAIADKTAYARFASVHRQFGHVEEIHEVAKARGCIFLKNSKSTSPED